MKRLPADILARFVEMEALVSADRGGVLFFALSHRENSPTLWDLVFAATWARPGSLDDLRYLAGKLHEAFGGERLGFLSHIAIVPPDIPGLADVARLATIRDGIAELRDEMLFAQPIDRAYLIAWPDAVEATGA